MRTWIKTATQCPYWTFYLKTISSIDDHYQHQFRFDHDDCFSSEEPVNDDDYDDVFCVLFLFLRHPPFDSQSVPSLRHGPRHKIWAFLQEFFRIMEEKQQAVIRWSYPAMRRTLFMSIMVSLSIWYLWGYTPWISLRDIIYLGMPRYPWTVYGASVCNWIYLRPWSTCLMTMTNGWLAMNLMNGRLWSLFN